MASISGAETSGLRSSLMVAMAAGIGMTWGPIFFGVLYELVRRDWLRLLALVLAAALAALLVWRFVVPFLARLFGRRRDVPLPPLQARAFVRPFAAALATGLVLSPVVEHFTVNPNEWGASALGVLIGGIITFGWAQGARRKRRRVALSGLVYGLIAGVLAGLITLAILHVSYEGRWSGRIPVNVLIAVVLLPLFLIPYGPAVGFLIDRLRRIPIGLRLGMGLAAAFVMLHVPIALLAPPREAADLILQQIFAVLGWFLGIVICPGALEVLTPQRERHAGAPAVPAEPADLPDSAA